jgi:hypothetical protein
MAFIIKGGHRDFPKPKIKRFLAIGTGESTMDFVKSKKEVPGDYIRIGLHKALPYLHQNSNIRLDYWTWGDPDASLDGLALYTADRAKELPTVINPEWLTTSKKSGYRATDTRVYKNRDTAKIYDDRIKRIEDLGKLHIIKQSEYAPNTPKTPEHITDPKNRFSSGTVIFGTHPQGVRDWQLSHVAENKFTSAILPICHYLGADEVYNLGFDNQGMGIQRQEKVHRDSKRVPKSLELFKKWKVDWAPYHKMEIFSVIPDKFTNINSILGFKEL